MGVWYHGRQVRLLSPRRRLEQSENLHTIGGYDPERLRKMIGETLHALLSSPLARDPACPVMSEALSLPSCPPPRSSVWSRLPPEPLRRVTVTHD